MTVTTASAARLARVSVRVIRAWCRTGALKAVKSGGRWAVTVASLRDLLARLRPGVRPATVDHRRPGEAPPQRTGRAARVRIGHHMSVVRCYAVLNAHVARFNAGRATAASYLTEVLGVDGEFVRRFASGFGKAATAAHRAHTGDNPQRDCIARIGRRRFVQCFSYDLRDLDEAARTFPRTAAVLSA